MKRKSTAIDKNNSIPMFKRLIHRFTNEADNAGLENAMKSMGEVVRSLIKDSMGDMDYQRAIENIGALREACIGLEFPELYNDFIKDLKKKIYSDALGKRREEMWKTLRLVGRTSLGLITKSEIDASDVTQDEAEQVRDQFNSSCSPMSTS